MKEPQLLVFDLDGTLIDSRDDLAAGINYMRRQLGLHPLSIGEVVGYIGNGMVKLVERSLYDAPQEEDLEKALRINREYYLSHLTIHTHLYDGVAEGIRKLTDAGHKLAVLTNKPGEACRKILKHFNLDSYFSEIIGGGDLDKLKPAPDGIFQCLEVSGIDPSNAWMAGDHYTDLAAAQNAGIKSIFLEYGFGNAGGYRADLYFASFPALTAYFIGR